MPRIKSKTPYAAVRSGKLKIKRKLKMENKEPKTNNNEHGKEKWVNIETAHEEREEVVAKESVKYEVNPNLAKLTFVATPATKREYGRETTVIAVNLHKNWTKQITLTESQETFVRLCGPAEYKAKVGWLESRKKGKEGRKYIGISVQVEAEIVNVPFEIGEFISLEKIGFIKKV